MKFFIIGLLVFLLSVKAYGDFSGDDIGISGNSIHNVRPIDRGTLGKITAHVGSVVDKNFSESVNNTPVHFHTDDSFSISFWRNDTSHSPNEHIFGTTRNLGVYSSGYICLTEQSDNCDPEEIYFSMEGATDGNEVSFCINHENLADGRLHHYVITYDGKNDKCEVWIDGKNTPITFVSGSCDLIPEPINGGGDNGKWHVSQLDGTDQVHSSQEVNEFYVWDKKLTEAEVQDLYADHAGSSALPSLFSTKKYYCCS